MAGSRGPDHSGKENIAPKAQIIKQRFDILTLRPLCPRSRNPRNARQDWLVHVPPKMAVLQEGSWQGWPGALEDSWQALRPEGLCNVSPWWSPVDPADKRDGYHGGLWGFPPVWRSSWSLNAEEVLCLRLSIPKNIKVHFWHRWILQDTEEEGSANFKEGGDWPEQRNAIPTGWKLESFVSPWCMTMSITFSDGLVFLYNVLFISTAWSQSLPTALTIMLAVLSGLVLGMSTGCAHNFIHQVIQSNPNIVCKTPINWNHCLLTER